MDYLRQVGGSKEAAKELKLFNLSDFLTDRFQALSQPIYEENVALNRRRLFWGGLLSVLGQLGYYCAYAYSILRTIQGPLQHRRSDADHDRDHAGHEQYPAGVLHRVGSRRPGSVPHRPAGILRDEAGGEVKAQWAAGAAADRARLRISQCFFRLSGHQQARS